MSEAKIKMLERALERQKKARKSAEHILESKSRELFETARLLQDSNERLKEMLNRQSTALDGVFMNVLDPYLVMDLQGNPIRMNNAAKEFLGFDHEKNPRNLATLVHPKYRKYTRKSLEFLLAEGALKNYRARIYVADGGTRYVQISCSLIYNPLGTPIAAQGIIRDMTQEREVNKLLAKQKSQLDIIVENSPLGIVLSKDDEIERCNKTFLNMLGYTLEELKEINIDKLSLYDSKAEVEALEARMKEGEISNFTVQKRYRRKDGSTFMARTSVSAVRDSDGALDFQVALVEDITAQYEAELEILASRSRLASLVQNLNSAVLLEDENRKIALTNQKFCNLFGIPANPEQLIGADCTEAAEQSKTHFKDEAGFVKRIKQVLKGQKLVQNDILEMKDGRILERDFIPIQSGGSYKGHLWTYTDVTLRKRYKESLEQQREKYSSIIANMNLGLIEVDKEDRIQMVNQSFLQMSGFEKKDLIGKPATSILRLENPEIIDEKLKLRKSGKSDSYELKVLTKKGDKRFWLVSGAPNYNEAGLLIGSIGIHLDITALKQLELQKESLVEELKERNLELEEYAHVVSHDLKSPLRSIDALTSWLIEDQGEKLDLEARAQLELIQEKVEGMDNLINGILEYSSISREQQQHKDVDLNQVVSSIRDIIYTPDHVAVVILNPLPAFKAIATQMHQLFQNLISNAVSHIDKESGIVEVDVEDLGDFWQFSIRDNGVGIPEEYHSKIFDIFESMDSGSNAGGTGIGLSIVKKIVTIYGGQIWLESTLGQGTTFYFTLKKI